MPTIAGARRALPQRIARTIRPGDPILATAAALSIASVLAGSSLAPGLAGLAQAFDAAPGALWVRLLVSVPALGVPLGAMLTGVLWRQMETGGGGPATSSRTLLVAALWVYALCGAAGAVGLRPGPMLALRLVQGVALGPVMMSAFRLLMSGRPDRLPDRLAVQSITMTGATLLILPLAAISASLSWRLPFLLNLLPLILIPAVLALPADAFAERDTATATSRGGRAASPQAPMLPGLLLAGAAMAIFFAVPTQMAGYLQGHGFTSPLAAAALIALSVLAAALAGAALRRRSGQPLPLPAALTWGFLALALGAFQLAFARDLPPMLVGVALIGAGFGVLFPLLNHWAMVGSSAAGTARGTAAMTAAFHLGQFVAPILGSAAIRPGAPGRVFLPYMTVALGALVLARAERRALGQPGAERAALAIAAAAPEALPGDTDALSPEPAPDAEEDAGHRAVNVD